MDWLPNLVKDYLVAREQQIRNRLATPKSWLARSSAKTRNCEMQLLMELEMEFNKEWVSKVKTTLSKNSVSEKRGRGQVLT